MSTQMNAAMREHAAMQDNPDLIIGDDGLARPAWAAKDQLLRDYYDTEWGMPVRDEAGVFERVVLEGFQCGLSWRGVLVRREALREAFAGFFPDAVAVFTDEDVERLLQNPAIFRNRRKIEAAISNARATVLIREEGTDLAELVWSFQPETTPTPRTMAEVPSTSPESEALAKELKRRGFKYVGPVTMYALMESIGIIDTHLLGSHRRGSSGVWGTQEV